jgi:hypothetical protein
MNIITTANLDVRYLSTSYKTNETADVGVIGQGESVNPQIIIKNVGNTNLQIQLGGIKIINFLNNSTIVNNPTTTASVTILPNREVAIVLSLDSVSVGTYSSNIEITTNDLLTEVFNLIIAYEVKPAYDISVTVDGSEIDSDDNISLGSVNQMADVFKTLRITNKGVSKTIRITDISYEGALLVSVTALPVILQTKENNAYQLSVKINTVSKGTKTGKLNIQWEVVN